MGYIATAVADGSTVSSGGDTAALHDTYSLASVATARALIAKVPGSGPVRGVHTFLGITYAIRDNAGATEGVLYSATTTGWFAHALGNWILFADAGAGVAYVEGEVIAGTTSGASATITRVMLTSGTWGVDAVGYLFVGDILNGPFQVEATTGSIAGAVPIAANGANILQPGGRYEFRDHNFRGSTITKRMYGVNSVSNAFEWDGTVFVQLVTGNVPDTPTHLEINEAHLMLAFPNGSLQNSSTGEPYQWAGGGAAEIGVGHEILGLQREIGGAMVIMCDEKMYQLLGKNTAASPWDLQDIAAESGGKEWTLQRLGRSRYLSDLGFLSVDAVQAYGNFASTAYSQVIQPLIDDKIALAISSVIIKKKEIIRTLFSDGTAISATFNNKKLVGFSTLSYIDSAGDPLVIRCTANGDDVNGSEIVHYGADDGYVYQAESGTSFDGAAIVANFVLSYNHLGSPAYDKAFKGITIEGEGSAGTTVSYNAKLDYSSGREPGGITVSKVLDSAKSYWNVGRWNIMRWSTEDVTLIEGSLEGTGRTISLQLSSNSASANPHKLFSVTYHYIIRKLVRK